MKKNLKIMTNVYEVYMKLPQLNYSNEVIFSNLVPDVSIKKILKNFNKNEEVLEAIKLGDRVALIKKKDVRFNTYLIS
jgi:hypothetical protein